MSSSPALSARLNSSYLRSAGFMVVGSMLFTGSHGLVRYVSGGGMHPLEMAFLANIFGFILYVPWLARAGLSALYTNQFTRHALRAVCNVTSLTTWYYGLSLTPLADATALATTMPLFSTLGAVVILGEPMHLRRWLALFLGVVGALIIIRPGFAAFSPGFAWVIASCVFGALSRVQAKQLSHKDSAITCSVYLACLQTPISFVMALFVWAPPSTGELGIMVAVGVLVAFAQLASVESMAGADIGSLEPLQYLRLVWAAVIGYLAFGEISVVWTWIGAAVIAVSTTYIMQREAKLAKRSSVNNSAGRAEPGRASLEGLADPTTDQTREIERA